MDQRMDREWWVLTLGIAILGLVVGSIAAWFLESLRATDPETAKHLGIAILFYLIGSFGCRCPKKRE